MRALVCEDAYMDIMLPVSAYKGFYECTVSASRFIAYKSVCSKLEID